MKIYYLFLSFVLMTFSFTLVAQDTDEKNDKIQAQKAAFLTERMNLNTKEAQLFWPVYNEFQDKKDKIIAQRRSTREYFKLNAATLTDKEANDILNKFVTIEQQDVNLFVEYNEKFKQVLPAKKVMQLYIAENQFKAWLISKLRSPVVQGNAGRRK